MITPKQETVTRKTPAGVMPCARLTTGSWTCTIKPVVVRHGQVIKWQVVMTKPVNRRKMFRVKTSMAAIEFATLFCEEQLRPVEKVEQEYQQPDLAGCHQNDCCGGIGRHAADCNYATGN